MKKILAMAMLMVLLFNMGGYSLLFVYFINRSDAFANEQISKGLYKPDELVEIKIPVDIPQADPNSDFQAISGQLQLSEANYNYVALKITRDTMFVMCIPNYEKTRLVEENIITAKQVGDVPLAKKNHVPSVKKTGTDKDFSFPVSVFNISYGEILTKADHLDVVPQLVSNYLACPTQPPEANTKA